MKNVCLFDVFLLCCLAGIRFTEASPCTRGPENFVKGQARKLHCDFNTPVRKVDWYKDDELIRNGTEGLYQSYDQLDDGRLRSILHFNTVRMHDKGAYICRADTTQKQLCPNGETIEVEVVCGKGYITAANKLVYAEQFSNTSLRCSAVSWLACNFLPPSGTSLTWLYQNITLQNNTKYAMKEHKTNGCEGNRLYTEFILDIYNVTFDDAGEYFCQMECGYGAMKISERDSIVLVSFVKPPETTEETTPHKAEPTAKTGSKVATWVVPVICACAAGFAVLLAAVYLFKKGKIGRNKRYKSNPQEEDLNNTLFISYSSKDYSWVTENLIALLDKHSIPYSIHTRDFELGKPIVQNMADSVYNSRKVLIVLSDNYLGSNFCREELHMAIQRGVDTEESSLILVTIDKFKKSRLPGALRNRKLMDFEKYKNKQDWERKLLDVVAEFTSLRV